MFYFSSFYGSSIKFNQSNQSNYMLESVRVCTWYRKLMATKNAYSTSKENNREEIYIMLTVNHHYVSS